MRVPTLRSLVLMATTVLVASAAPDAASGTVGAVVARGAGSPLTRVSGPSPYADCEVPTFPDEATFVNAEVEPWVAVDPLNAKHLVGVWQQDRHSFGGAKGLMSASSFDRGHTWQRTTLPFDACAPGGLDLERASDPWVSIGPDGIVYAVSLSSDAFGNGERSIAAATSADGGVSWSDPKIIHSTPPESGVFDDKESVTADPFRPGVAYVTWTALRFPSGLERDDEHLVADVAGVTAARASRPTGPLLFARTTDGGATWEKPRAIYHTAADEFINSNQIVVDPTTGTLYDFFDFGHNDRRWQKVMSSNDAGATWSEPVTISRDFSIGASHPNTGEALRVGDWVPDAAIDSRNGDLYVVWEDSRFSGFRYDEVALSRSTDGGRTWSGPIRVNTPTGLPAFVPSVEVNPRGFVGVSYYDVRDVGSATATLPTDAWLVKLRDGGRRRIGEWKLAGPFDMLTAPEAGGHFLGDYEGLAVSGDRFAALFAATNDGLRRNRTDIVFKLR
jgi:hypothetical protein